MSIFILSRPVRTGKTTGLKNWLATQENVSGILMPDVNGTRMFYDIRSKEMFPAQLIETNADAVPVGNFLFSQEGFNRANAILFAALSGDDDLVVIDEIGKLELDGKGFFEAANRLTGTCKLPGRDLLLVVRESLLENVIRVFGINDFIVSDHVRNFEFAHKDNRQ